MNRIKITPYFSELELKEAEKLECNHKIKNRIRAIRLLAFSPLKKNEIVEILGISRTTLLNWSHRYNQFSLKGLKDKAGPRGRKCLYHKLNREKIEEILSQPPPDGGLWNSTKLRLWMEKELNEPIGKTQGWKTLKRLGYSLQVPKPSNTKAKKADQAFFKKSAPKRINTYKKRIS